MALPPVAIGHDGDAAASAGDGAPMSDSATSRARRILVTLTQMGTFPTRVKLPPLAGAGH